MKNKILQIAILFATIILINFIVMPNYQFWIGTKAHSYAATIVLVFDFLFITMYLPTELTKLYYAHRKKIERK